eukprot:7388339-Prymnesium_polylepis.2
MNGTQQRTKAQGQGRTARARPNVPYLRIADRHATASGCGNAGVTVTTHVDFGLHSSCTVRGTDVLVHRQCARCARTRLPSTPRWHS